MNAHLLEGLLLVYSLVAVGVSEATLDCKPVRTGVIHHHGSLTLGRTNENRTQVADVSSIKQVCSKLQNIGLVLMHISHWIHFIVCIASSLVFDIHVRHDIVWLLLWSLYYRLELLKPMGNSTSLLSIENSLVISLLQVPLLIFAKMQSLDSC